MVEKPPVLVGLRLDTLGEWMMMLSVEDVEYVYIFWLIDNGISSDSGDT